VAHDPSTDGPRAGNVHDQGHVSLNQAALASMATGHSVHGTESPLLLGPFLEDWLGDVVRLSVRPKTFVSYRSIVRIHLAPALGDIAVADLRPRDVQAYLNAKAASGLAPRTVAYQRNILRQALGHAERTELVWRNVAKLALPPRIPRREVHPLTPDQARTFLAAIATDPQEALYLIAIGVGLRQGEILGLRWPDVDLEAGTIRVRAALQRVEGAFAFVEPKSSTSRRLVPLPAIVRDALVRHRERQPVRTGSREVDPAFAELVFTTTAGQPIDGISVTRRFQRILRSAGLPHQRFHDLRHACASLLLSQGVPARVVERNPVTHGASVPSWRLALAMPHTRSQGRQSRRPRGFRTPRSRPSRHARL
jgi:integrase